MEQGGVSAEAARISVMLQVWVCLLALAKGLIELALICNGHTSTLHGAG